MTIRWDEDEKLRVTSHSSIVSRSVITVFCSVQDIDRMMKKEGKKVSLGFLLPKLFRIAD